MVGVSIIRSLLKKAWQKSLWSLQQQQIKRPFRKPLDRIQMLQDSFNAPLLTAAFTLFLNSSPGLNAKMQLSGICAVVFL
jgi:hypothetical protein